MVTKTREKTREEFYCKICDYGCRDKYNMTRHLSSTKHQMVTNGNKNEAKRGKPYICHCGKVYKFRSGLSRHKKKCSPQNIIMDQTSMNDDSPCSGSEILELCKTMKKLVEDNRQKTELMGKMLDQNAMLIPKVGNNNNKISINVFLIERC